MDALGFKIKNNLQSSFNTKDLEAVLEKLPVDQLEKTGGVLHSSLLGFSKRQGAKTVKKIDNEGERKSFMNKAHNTCN